MDEVVGHCLVLEGEVVIVDESREKKDNNDIVVQSCQVFPKPTILELVEWDGKMARFSWYNCGRIGGVVHKKIDTKSPHRTSARQVPVDAARASNCNLDLSHISASGLDEKKAEGGGMFHCQSKTLLASNCGEHHRDMQLDA